MKYLSEFRDGKLARGLAAALKEEVLPDRQYSFMEFCGGHTHAIFQYGLVDLLPDNLKMVHGPGCPVCVMPINRIDSALWLLENHNVILCSYGDLLRVPGSKRRSLLKAKARGADVRMVYSTTDAIKIAQDNPDREVVFYGVGFETTTPPSAMAIKMAQALELTNFSLYCNHVLTPPAIGHILESPEVREFGTVKIDGFLGPSHVSTIIGLKPYQFFVEEYYKPVVVTGFEPLDVLQGILMLVRQINAGEARVENQYRRGVSPDGNIKAQNIVADVFELNPSFPWRGLGNIPYSGLRIKQDFSAFDAEKKFAMPTIDSMDHPACQCGAILRGVKSPLDCKVFGNGCTPDNPLGPCMVSSEGACSAYYNYGQLNGGQLNGGHLAEPVEEPLNL